MTTSYALQIGSTKGTYADFDSLPAALLAACAETSERKPVTVVQVDGDGNDLTFKPLCVVSPPSSELGR